MYTDGSCKNSGTKNDSMGVGIVIYASGIKVLTHSAFVGYGTSTIAEWEAFMLGSVLLKNYINKKHVHNIKRINIYLDSQVVVNMYNDKYKSINFKYYYNLTKQTLNSLRVPVYVNWVNREKNTVSDKLSKINPKLHKDKWNKL